MIDDLAHITAKTLEHYSARAADFWEGTRGHDVTQNIGALLRNIRGLPPFRILDLGCGPGRDLAAFRDLGHHAIGLGVYRPRCLEEYHVWVWALREMRERGFNVTPAVEKRMHDSLKYAVRKARRRGLQSLPAELRAYT